MEAMDHLWAGIIMMVVIGPAIGNYATSVVYRLPFGQTPFEKNPYCGDCGTMLTPADLFPIWSYVLSRGKCRHCGVQIRPSYTVIEVACGVLFVANFVLFGMSEDFLLNTAIGVFLIILCGLEYHEKTLFTLILTYLFALTALYRGVVDGTIYGFVTSGFIALFASVVVWRVLAGLKRADAAVIPPFVWLFSLMGVALPVTQWPLALAVTVVAYALQRALWGWRFGSIAVALGIYAGLLGYGLSFNLKILF